MGGRPDLMGAIDRLRAGDKLHLQYVDKRRVWWFEAPHEVVSEKEIAQALNAGEIGEAGDSLFGLPFNSQTFLIEASSLADPGPHYYSPSWLHMGDCSVCGHQQDHPNHIEPTPKRPSGDLFGQG